MRVKAVGAALLAGVMLSACGIAEGNDLRGQRPPMPSSASEYSATDVYAVANTAPEADAAARTQTEEAIEGCLAAPGVSSRREARPPARYIVSLTASATGPFEACLSSVRGAALTPYVPPGGELPRKPGQQVVPDHCGIQPVTYDGRLWEVKRAPFDMGNAPDTFSGFGEFRVEGDLLQFVDREGAMLTFTLDDGIQPTCA